MRLWPWRGDAPTPLPCQLAALKRIEHVAVLRSEFESWIVECLVRNRWAREFRSAADDYYGGPIFLMITSLGRRALARGRRANAESST